MSALLAAALVLTPSLDATAKRKKRKPPLLELEVRRGKVRLGTEVLRSQRFEKISNYSTIAKLRDKGRRFTQRTHTKFDQADKIIQYNRWVDVKGASTREIVFAVADVWKLRSGDTTSGKFKLTDLTAAKSPLVLLDDRSPTLVHVAIDRAAGRSVHFARVDNGTSGALTVRVENLKAVKSGKAFKRYTLTGDKLKATLLRDDKGKTVHVNGPGPYSGWAKGFVMPARFEVAAADDAAAPTPAAPAPDDAAAAPKPPAAPPAAPPAPPAPKADLGQ